MSGRTVSRRTLIGKATLGSLALGTGLSGLGLSNLARAEGAPHWSYEGPEGPGHWGALSPETAVCGRGERQSPVDLAGAGIDKAADLAIAWQPFDAVVEHNGHTLQVAATGATNSSLALGGKTYGFLQFHFHHPSEHAVAGGRWPLEVHMVHKSEAGDLAVIGIFFRPGRESDMLGAVLSAAPRSKGKAPVARPIDMNRFLPASATTYRYAGSLTTPPCSEIVSWSVFREPIEASVGQIETFAQLFPMNARPLQQLFQRHITLDMF